MCGCYITLILSVCCSFMQIVIQRQNKNLLCHVQMKRREQIHILLQNEIVLACYCSLHIISEPGFWNARNGVSTEGVMIGENLCNFYDLQSYSLLKTGPLPTSGSIPDRSLRKVDGSPTGFQITQSTHFIRHSI